MLTYQGWNAFHQHAATTQIENLTNEFRFRNVMPTDMTLKRHVIFVSGIRSISGSGS